MKFSRIAIINRGEPAMRLINAVGEFNAERGTSLCTIALYTAPDRQAMFVREADESYDLGPAAFTDAQGRRMLRYLDYEALERALIATGADAAWVGWGFVAEHAAFAELCQRLGVVFIGPDPDVMRRLGDKITSKQIAESAEVPVAPWSGEPVETVDEARRHADRLGYPVMIKATAGGGGRGIRRVASPDDLDNAFSAAKSEAFSAFGDDTMFIEAMVGGARHIEVQIIGDDAGTVWPVGVRDCSVQRRNQKLLEEAPSPILTSEQDREVKEAAARLGRAAGYRNAGTVEFLYDEAARAFSFMEVNARLQVEHPVTELTTGVDMVKLQLAVANGELLEGPSPETVGHAIEARLNAEDPERGFTPAPGTVELLRMPVGPGIRIDTGIEVGDAIAPEFDSMVAKVLAYGNTREEARARLLRALSQMRVIVRDGTSNKAFLRGLLAHEDFVEGRFDIGWVDRLVAEGKHLADDNAGLALIAAAIAAYDEQLETDVARFRAAAARGRPEVDDHDGQVVRLRHRGQRYSFQVEQTSEQSYRVGCDEAIVAADVEDLGRTGFRLTCAGRSYRVLAVVHGATHVVEVDGVSHRITHDEGGVVRAPSPSVVVAMLVEPGDRVKPGDRLAVIEAMKMETTLVAELPGTVDEILISENVQVATGTPLLRIDPDTDAAGEKTGRRIDLSALGLAYDDLWHRGCQHYLDSLHHMLLGWDVQPAHLQELAAPGSSRCPRGAADPEVRALEDEVLGIFLDIIALFRRSPRGDETETERRSSEEYLFDYLSDLGASADRLPPRFVEQLRRTLAHYGVDSLEPTPQLERALYQIARSQARMSRQTQAVLTVLEDRLAHAEDGGERFRRLLDRLIQETRNRYPAVNDIAREIHYRALDMPFLEQIRAQKYDEVEQILGYLAANPEGPDISEKVTELVDCPQPLKPLLSSRFGDASPHMQRIMLEVITRRYYRIRDLGPFTTYEAGGYLFSAAEYDFEGRPIHVVSTHLAYQDLLEGTRNLHEVLARLSEDHDVVVDIYVWQAQPRGTPEISERHVRRILDETLGDLALRRIVVAISGSGTGTSLSGVLNFTFRGSPDGHYHEESEYRDLHPMMAKRLELWRLSNFETRRLPTTEDIYLFHGVALDNPRDERLFGFAEVRDLTPLRDEDGKVVGVPEFERVYRDVLGPIRHFQAHRPTHKRLHWNRVQIYVWPELTFGSDEITALVQRLAPETEGLGLERVSVRVRVRNAKGKLKARLLEISNPGGRGVRLSVRKPWKKPMQPLSDLDQKVVRLRQRGMTHPSEILGMLAPPREHARRGFPPGTFVEHDLVGDRLEPVERRVGRNEANVVVGVVTNVTERYPDGMQRVIILGDPTRGVGNLSERECHRINAALDLAEEMGVPLEWFAVSAGALISMESGTENMDWIGRVLRRIIEFTQNGGELNIIVVGINVGAQPYWNAEATMLMHTKGILVMTPEAAMVLTGKQALDYSGGVSAEDNQGIGGYERIMGPNGQAQYFASNVEDACRILLAHYEYAYVQPGERFARPAVTNDPAERDAGASLHGGEFATVGDIFSDDRNPGRKQPFEIRKVMAAVVDQDLPHMERWHGMQHAEIAVTWDAFLGGRPVSLIGFESKPVNRLGFVPADGPLQWTSGTLFPVASKKVARAVNAASGNRPLVVLANLSGFDGSPESMRRWQLEYGAEIGRAIVNFEGPIVFCVVSRYHGGAFVVFSATLNDNMEVAAIEGSRASVIGGAPAAAVVFTREVTNRTNADPRVTELTARVSEAEGQEKAELRSELEVLAEAVRAEHLGAVADEFDQIHDVHRALEVGSIHRIIPGDQIRPYLIDAVVRGIDKELERLGKKR
jgi:acetyl/propionyl-CoA carboxylase alpha subunit/acetyl-CoA carboxylase carboxyltransferase component